MTAQNRCVKFARSGISVAVLPTQVQRFAVPLEMVTVWKQEQMGKKHKSDAMAAIHEMMEDLHVGGVIGKQTMRRFDDACLTPIPQLKPKEIKAIWRREHVTKRFSPTT